MLLLAVLVMPAIRPTLASVVVITADRAFEAADVTIDTPGSVHVTGGEAAKTAGSISTGQLTLLIFDVLPSDAPARAWLCLQDGRRLSGESVTVGAGEVSLRTARGSAVTAPLVDTSAVFFKARRPNLASPPAEGVRIVSTNGDVLNAPALDWTDAGLLVEVNPSLDPIPLPLDRLAAILWPVRTGTTASTPSREAGLPLIDLRTGERLAGRIESLDAVALRMRTATGELSIPRHEVESIWFESPKVQNADELVPPPQARGERPSWRRGRSGLGGPLRIDGRFYGHGFGLRAPATVDVPVPAGARWLVAMIGPDADAAPFARMTIEVLVDGRQLFVQQQAAPGQAGRRVALPVKGAAKVALSVKSVGTNPTACLGDFADVFFIQ